MKPRRLESGMTIGLIAPSSAPGKVELIEKGMQVLNGQGFKTKLGKNALAKKGYLSGTDKQKLADFHAMFADPKIDAVICLRGGYGTPRLLRYVDFDLIRKNPKIFVGFSDITGLHIPLLIKSRLVTFHGPMLTSNIAHEEAREYSMGSLMRMITEPKPFGSILPGSGTKKGKTLNKGKATGTLIGGNLSLLTTFLGTPWDFSTKGKILFIEDVGEANYRIDRLLTHLLNAGKLESAAGIVLGQFSDTECKPTADGRPTQTVEEIIHDRLKALKIPIAYGFPFGHEKITATLPLGIKATLDATKGDLIIEESAVR
ncbi:LD-carboxypeptidase [Candidatus Sumerlaeota bacterium]|nr:LD-carboxypeptidase [Candidatus Sumerlaeota bacterium]